MKTGETITDLGVYVSECCGAEIIFDMGDQFAKCPMCNVPCVWEMEEEVAALDEFDHRMAA